MEQTIVYGTVTVSAGAVAEQPANVSNIDQTKWSNFNTLNATMDFFIKAKHSMVIDCSIILTALKTKIIFVASKTLHDFCNLVMGPSGTTSANPLVLGDDANIAWTYSVLKTTQGAAEIQ